MRSTTGPRGRWRRRLLPVAGLIAGLTLAGCRAGPDWAGAYSRKLGQPVEELNTAAIESPWEDESGNLTRATWARLADGTTVLLGLPSHGLPTQEVVDRTVVLTEDEWTQRCREAFPGRDIAQVTPPWRRDTDKSHLGNTLLALPEFTRQVSEGFQVSEESREDGYCEFAHVADGWELRVVRRLGFVKTDGVPGTKVEFGPGASEGG